MPSIVAVGTANVEMQPHAAWAQEAFVLMKGSNVGTQTSL